MKKCTPSDEPPYCLSLSSEISSSPTFPKVFPVLSERKNVFFFKLSVCLHDERRLLNTFLKLNVHDIRMNQKVEDTTQSNMVYVVKEKETYQTGTQVSSTFNPIIESDNLSKNRPVSTDLREFLFSKLFVLKIIFFKKLSDWKTSAVLLTFNSTDFIT